MMRLSTLMFKGIQMLQIDTMTIDAALVRKLKEYTLPPTYKLSDSPGNGCAGDPPGFPSYYTYSVYTQHGNNPRNGPYQVLVLDDKLYRVPDDCDARGKSLRRLWKPLPLDHERTRLWILSKYSHFKDCYYDPSITSGDSLVVFPVPSYKLKAFHDDPRWNDEYRAACIAEVNAFNKQVIDQTTAVATPENHAAVQRIQNYYPEYKPEIDLIEHPPTQVPQWWETLRKAPTHKGCAASQRWGHKHPMNGTWCQWCGWKQK